MKSLTEFEARTYLSQGQELGLAYFIEQYQPALIHYAWRIVDNREMAEDLTSVAFLKLWNVRTAIKPNGSVKAWLYSTVRHAAIDEIRQIKRSRLSTVDLKLHYALAGNSLILNSIEGREIKEAMKTQLKFLPQKCGQVASLYYLNEMSYEEIAETMHISVHTVRNQKVRAIRKLRTQLREFLK